MSDARGPHRAETDIHQPLDRGDIKDLITSMDDVIAPEEFLCGTEARLRSLAPGDARGLDWETGDQNSGDFIGLQGHEQNPRAQRYMMGIDE